MAIDKYLNLITSQHRLQPNFIAWLSSPLTMIDDGITASNDISSSYDIDNAVGVQLDTIGQFVGVNRTLNYQPGDGSPPVMDDVHYRLALKARIAWNNWDGTIQSVYDLWNSIFPDVGIIIVDNQNMTMSALVEGTLDSMSTDLVANGYIIPKPMGVSLTIMGVTVISGQEYVGSAVSGYDVVTLNVNGG